MILKDGSRYEIEPELLETLSQAYPQVDLSAEIQKMEAWCACNPRNRKTRRGIKRFINSWLNRAASRSASRPTSTRSRSLHDDLTDTGWAL